MSPKRKKTVATTPKPKPKRRASTKRKVAKKPKTKPKRQGPIKRSKTSAKAKPSRCVKTEFLQGPIELDILDRPSDHARIVLLGDKHVHKEKCPEKAECKMTIIKYLDNLFTNYRRPQNLDFFLEIEFAEHERGMDILTDPQQLQVFRGEIAQGNIYQSFLASLRIYFYNCLQKVKTKCEFAKKRQIRFHYSDPREGVLHSQTSTEGIEIIKDLQSLRKVETAQDLNIDHFNVLGRLFREYRAKNVDFFFHISKIDKQLREIGKTNQGMVVKLRQYMEDDMNDNSRKANDFYELLVDVRHQFTDMGKPDLEIFNQLRVVMTTHFLTPLFDIYTLARIIRHDMKQVIIYAGAHHTGEMKKFFVSNMGYQATVSKASAKQCMNLGGVPQPWF